MNLKVSSKDVVYSTPDEEQYQLKSKPNINRLQSKKIKKHILLTKWNIFILVFALIIIGVLFKIVLMIVTGNMIAKEKVKDSSFSFLQKQQTQSASSSKNNDQNIIKENIMNNFQKQTRQIRKISQANQDQQALISSEHYQNLPMQRSLKKQQQQTLLLKLGENNQQQLKENQKSYKEQEEKNNLPQIQKNNQQKLSIQHTLSKATTQSQTIKPIATLNSYINSTGISDENVAMALKFIKLKNLPKQDSLADQQREYYQKKYNLNQYTQQLPFCIVVPSYKNVANNRYIYNINSILQQQYSNYHVVFIDDASPDNTFNKLSDYLKTKKLPKNKIKMIKNQKQMFAMYNLRKAAMEHCKPEQIFMIVDGDDELLGRQIFRFFNAMFQQKQAYFIYTNFITTKGTIGYSREYPYNIKNSYSYRGYPFVTSHLRAFYTKLFQLIDDKDLRDDKGVYYRAANDVAICFPILEMSHTRVEYIPQISYVYNSATGLNNHNSKKKEQHANGKQIQKKKKYSQVRDIFQIIKQEQTTKQIKQNTLSKQG